MIYYIQYTRHNYIYRHTPQERKEYIIIRTEHRNREHPGLIL